MPPYRSSSLPQLLLTGGNVIALLAAAIAAGALVSQVCLLAIWAALGGQPLAHRLPASIGLLCLAHCSYLTGLRSANDLDQEIVIIFTFFSLMLFLTVLTTLLVGRLFTGQVIATDLHPVVSERRVSMRYLLMLTFGSAIVVVAAQKAVAGIESSGTFPNITQVAAITSLMAAVSTLICLPCVRLALGKERSPLHLFWLILALVGCPLVIVGLMSGLFGPAPDAQVILIGFHLYALGLAGATLGGLRVAHQLGLKLVSLRRDRLAA